MGLVKTCGSVGFLVGGLGAMRIGQSVLDLPADFWFESDWHGSTASLFLFSFLAAFAGAAIGRGFGASIRVADRGHRHRIDVLWHCAANGYLIWSFLMICSFARLLGRQRLEQLVRSLGSARFTVYAVGIGTAGALLIGVVLLALRLWRAGERPRLLAATFAALPVTLAMSWLLYTVLGLASKVWLVVGLLVPPLLIPLSAYTLLRDEVFLRRLLAEDRR